MNQADYWFLSTFLSLILGAISFLGMMTIGIKREFQKLNGSMNRLDQWTIDHGEQDKDTFRQLRELDNQLWAEIRELRKEIKT